MGSTAKAAGASSLQRSAMWGSSGDLLREIHEAQQRIKMRETDAGSAHAEARLIGAAIKLLDLSMEYSRLTMRLREDCTSLPDIPLLPPLTT